MSAIENLFFRWEMQDLAHPEFTRVFKGFDPGEVEEFVGQIVERIQTLEESVERLRQERDSARQAASAIREEAYREVATRMAAVVQAADESAAVALREAKDSGERQVAEAMSHSEQLHRDAEAAARKVRLEAEAHAERLRTQAADMVAAAQEESDRTLGGLETKRSQMLEELAELRERVGALGDLLDGVLTSRGVVVAPPPEPSASAPAPTGPAPDAPGGADDLLDLSSIEDSLGLLDDGVDETSDRETVGGSSAQPD